MKITLKSNETKDIKVFSSLENTVILMKETTEKIISEEGGVLSNFLGPSMKVGLPLIKTVLT